MYNEPSSSLSTVRKDIPYTRGSLYGADLRVHKRHILKRMYTSIVWKCLAVYDLLVENADIVQVNGTLSAILHEIKNVETRLLKQKKQRKASDGQRTRRRAGDAADELRA
ncbi:hypothetical protein EVAR_27169_1 [Eumeta japonica]|uniref:Uncharacterized protein n=1 Tax=Eumeta variegata TaxID=151549 RepID=A0A4C1VZH5_EUMVA|nr:hypothetical protein EVAR_27169_1 [Eumeta japonica]